MSAFNHFSFCVVLLHWHFTISLFRYSSRLHVSKNTFIIDLDIFLSSHVEENMYGNISNVTALLFILQACVPCLENISKVLYSFCSSHAFTLVQMQQPPCKDTYMQDMAHLPIRYIYFDEIDVILEYNNIFRLQNFHFKAGDCLFYSLA